MRKNDVEQTFEEMLEGLATGRPTDIDRHREQCRRQAEAARNRRRVVGAVVDYNKRQKARV